MGIMDKFSTDDLLDAAEAYEAERDLWSFRVNKSFSPTRYEIIRASDGDVEVVASTTGLATAEHEVEEHRMRAAITSAMLVLDSRH